jgi:flavin reductase ActVB
MVTGGYHVVTSMACLDKDALLRALAKFPTGVAIVTTLDGAGRRWGFTASAFTSLSLDPPQVLVCLAHGADCYTAFSNTDRFAANVLRVEHEPLARRFATKGAAKFAGGEFVFSDLSLPVLPDALAVIECGIAARLPGGDHTIIIGDVRAARCGSGEPAIYHDRVFRRFA